MKKKNEVTRKNEATNYSDDISMSMLMKKHDRMNAINQYPAFLDDEKRFGAITRERENRMNSSYWQGNDPRRRQELADGGMVTEDRNAPANCPQEFIHREFPQIPYYSTPVLQNLRDQQVRERMEIVGIPSIEL